MKLNWPDGLSEAKFLQSYWQQKPLLIKEALPGFETPLDPNELAGIACEDDASARVIEHLGNNEWRMAAGPFDAAFFDTFDHNEWSLLVSDVEKLLPEFRQYLQPFRFLPDWRIDDLMISYAPVGGSVGAHVDQYDVFLMQASGVREWQIETSPRQTLDSVHAEGLALLGDFNADNTWQLQPGDILYLPPLFAHSGVAVAAPCTTWSIGFRAPSVDEMLPDVLRYLSGCDNAKKRYTDKQRILTNTPGQITLADITELREMLKNALSQDDATLDTWIGKHITEPNEPQFEEQINTELSLPENVAALIVNSQKRVAYTEHNSDSTLFANGEAYTCSSALASAMCNQHNIQINQFNTEDIELIKQLYAQEILLEPHQ